MFLQRLLIGAIGFVTVGAMSRAVVAAAQSPHHGWHHGGQVHDTRTEARVIGTVEAVNLAGPDDDCCCGAGAGTHVTLKTNTESIDVHLGPTVWLREQGISLVAGDRLEILGSRVTMRGGPVLMAREVKKGETTWTLRAAQGQRGACWH